MERRIEYATVSDNLYSGMQVLLRKLGYMTNVQRCVYKNDRWKPVYKIYITGKQVENFNAEFGGLNVKEGNIRYIPQ